METRQKQAGQAIRRRSRERLLLGAAEVFAENGYTQTTVNAIADRSGVSLATLYAAWGSKRALLRAYVEYTMTGSPTGVSEGSWIPQLQGLLDDERPADARVRVRKMAKLYRTICERMSLPWQLLRDGAAVDPEVAQDHAELEQLRRHTMAGILTGITETDLRSGLTRERAIDTLLVIASPSSYQILVQQSGYTMDQFEQWLADTLTATLLAPPPPK